MCPIARDPSWRLLMIDDDALFAAQVARAFHSAPFGLTFAGALNHALELLERERHDVLLLDLGLPDSSGFDTFERVTAAAPGVPVIILTTDDGDRLDLRALQPAVHGYVAKHEFDAPTLVRTVRHAIKRAAIARSRQEKSEQLRLMLRELPICIWSTDRDLRMTTSESAALRQFDMQSDGSVGLRLVDYLGPDSTIVGQSYRALAGESVHYECVWQDRTLAIHQEPLRDANGAVIGTVGISTDITESRRTHERLHEYEKAIEGVEEMIVVIDRDYRYLIANRAFLAHRQIAKEQLLGRAVHEFIDRSNWNNVVKGKIDECFDGKTVTYELRSSFPQLGERHITVSLFPVHGPSGVDRVAAVMHDVTERKAGELRLQDALTELRAVSTRLNVVREQERARIAREIHDQLGQAITALKMDIAEVGRRLKRADVAGAQARLAEMSSLINSASDDVRRVATELRPVILDELGLIAAIRSHLDDVRRRGIKCVLTADPATLQLANDEVATAVFRIMQEAVTNVLRHARARHVHVTLTLADSVLRLIVEDDGRGMPPPEQRNPAALGIVGMRDRTLLFGGDLIVSNSPRGGTIVAAHIPLAEDR